MLQPGLQLAGRYRLDARIGAGGMGEVWRAFDQVLGRVVAVKAMLPEVAGQPDFAQRFLVEAKAMASVNHPAVASIHDYGSSAGVTFLVMEFIDGQSLSQVLGRVGRLGAADTMRLIAQAADGLRAVHDQGIVHRDIKPANLLVRRDGSLLITDFGISRTPDGTALTSSGAILGTPTYLSPEQVLGRPATARTDIYSLGLVAYECLTGRKPFTGDNPYAVALQRVQSGPPALDGDVPPAVAAVVGRALAVDPADRWPTATDLASAARAAAGEPSPAAVHAATGESKPDTPGAAETTAGRAAKEEIPAKPRRGMLIALMLIAVIPAGTAVWQGLDKNTDTPRPAVSTTPAISTPGFAPCGPVLCPTTALCWNGLTGISGQAMAPQPVACDGRETHVWETYAALPMPADAATAGETNLIVDSPTVAAACSDALLQQRSRDPRSIATGWRREAWPIQLGQGPRLVHCLAQPPAHESTGSAFKTVSG